MSNCGSEGHTWADCTYNPQSPNYAHAVNKVDEADLWEFRARNTPAHLNDFLKLTEDKSIAGELRLKVAAMSDNFARTIPDYLVLMLRAAKELDRLYGRTNG